MSNYLGAIDQGTTSTRFIVFDRYGRISAIAQKEHEQIFPKPGWVEHDANEIWRRTTEAIDEAMQQKGLQPKDLAAIGITNQRETTILWDRKTSRPIARAIVWQCRRTSDFCRQPRLARLKDKIRAKTGLVLDAYFSATKIRWLLDHVKGARALAASGRLCFGTVDSWLIWKLTGGASHKTDVTNASRTLLCNLEDLEWDPYLLDRFGVPREALPAIRPSIAREPYGHTLPDGPFGARVPVCGDLGDQQAALAGQGCFAAGEAKNTYGTGSFLLEHVGERPVRSSFGLLSTAARLDAKEVAITG